MIVVDVGAVTSVVASNVFVVVVVVVVVVVAAAEDFELEVASRSNICLKLLFAAKILSREKCILFGKRNFQKIPKFLASLIFFQQKVIFKIFLMNGRDDSFSNFWTLIKV